MLSGHRPEGLRVSASCATRIVERGEDFRRCRMDFPALDTDHYVPFGFASLTPAPPPSVAQVRAAQRLVGAGEPLGLTSEPWGVLAWLALYELNCHLANVRPHIILTNNPRMSASLVKQWLMDRWLDLGGPSAWPT
jgi:hypothetical protein